MAEELAIIQRVLNGDAESFRLLVERYAGPVIRMIRNTTGDSHTCEDLAQEVFLSAYVNLGAFDPARSHFATWLLTIARNKTVNAAKKKRPVCLADPPESTDLAGPDEAAVRNEFLVALDEQLLALPIEQRTAFVLAEFEHLSYQQIAQIEGVRVGTVKSRINRAKDKLMNALKRFGDVS